MKRNRGIEPVALVPATVLRFSGSRGGAARRLPAKERLREGSGERTLQRAACSVARRESVSGERLGTSWRLTSVHHIGRAMKLTERQREFLENPFVGTITDLRPDGSPHTTVVWVDADDDGLVQHRTWAGEAEIHRA
jgi:hypothetical protein